MIRVWPQNVPCGAGSTCPKAVLIRAGQGSTLETVALEADKPLPSTYQLTRYSTCHLPAHTVQYLPPTSSHGTVPTTYQLTRHSTYHLPADTVQ